MQFNIGKGFNHFVDFNEMINQSQEKQFVKAQRADMILEENNIKKQNPKRGDIKTIFNHSIRSGLTDHFSDVGKMITIQHWQ